MKDVNFFQFAERNLKVSLKLVANNEVKEPTVSISHEDLINGRRFWLVMLDG